MLHRVAPAVMAACLCLPFLTANAQGPDELWEITAKMTMDGMAMPAMPHTVCKKKGNHVPPAEKDCRIYDVKTAGNRTTWRVDCTGQDPMSGSGEMTMGNGSYRGTLKLKGKAPNDDATMVTEYSGRLVGKCTAK
jgi:hypothetical protein